MEKYKKLIIKFFFSSFFKFGLIALSTYFIEFVVYIFLLNFYKIFYSNIIAAFVGITLDYYISTSKKIKIFNIKNEKRTKLYFLYLIYISVIVIFLSWTIEYLDKYINQPVLSKIIVIPLGFCLNYLYFYLFTKKH